MYWHFPTRTTYMLSSGPRRLNFISWLGVLRIVECVLQFPPHRGEVFLISNFFHVLNVVCFLLGNSLVSDAGELPREKHTPFRTQWKFEIKNKNNLIFIYLYLCLFNSVPGSSDYALSQLFFLNVYINFISDINNENILLGCVTYRACNVMTVIWIIKVVSVYRNMI
jgi:hypothetical protein